MKYEMKMPDLATTASSIKILGWFKKPGDPVRRGECALEIETDKAAMEVEATVNGVFVEARAHVGAEVAAGDIIAIIETEDVPAGAAAAAPAAAPATAGAPRAGATAGEPCGMFARNRAAARPAAGAAPALSPARRTAARRLQESKQTIPHFYLQASARTDALAARRAAALPAKLLWDAFLVKAASNALLRFGAMAYRFENEALLPQGTSAIGVAADVQGELFVVSVDEPAGKDVAQISGEIEAAIDALRRGDADSRRVKPGVMTISNLGGTGVEAFSAIINPPESAILAVGAARPVVVPDGASFSTQQRMSLTLSVDHRVVNGKYAAQFLAAIVQEIESL